MREASQTFPEISVSTSLPEKESQQCVVTMNSGPAAASVWTFSDARWATAGIGTESAPAPAPASTSEAIRSGTCPPEPVSTTSCARLATW